MWNVEKVNKESTLKDNTPSLLTAESITEFLKKDKDNSIVDKKELRMYEKEDKDKVELSNKVMKWKAMNTAVNSIMQYLPSIAASDFAIEDNVLSWKAKNGSKEIWFNYNLDNGEVSDQSKSLNVKIKALSAKYNEEGTIETPGFITNEYKGEFLSFVNTRPFDPEEPEKYEDALVKWIANPLLEAKNSATEKLVKNLGLMVETAYTPKTTNVDTEIASNHAEADEFLQKNLS